MRDDYYIEALEIVGDPYVLVNMLWERMQMLRRGNRPLVESLEKLQPEDVALREIIEGKVTHASGYLVVLGKSVVLENIVMRTSAGGARSNRSTSPLINAPCHAGAST
jgi:DNA-directed RNA polymerase subunit omega